MVYLLVVWHVKVNVEYKSVWVSLLKPKDSPSFWGVTDTLSLWESNWLLVVQKSEGLIYLSRVWDFVVVD